METSKIPFFGEPLEIRIDIEHIGVRTATLTLVLGGLVTGYILGSAVAQQVDESLARVCVALPMALLVSFVMAQVSDRFIKRRWRSRRKILVDQKQLVYIDQRKKPFLEQTLDWDQPFDFKAWYFAVMNRRTRIPKDWYCLSLWLNQNEQKLVLYTFAPPESLLKNTQIADYFVQLQPRKEREKLVTADPRMAAQQNYLRSLESARWFSGAELEAADFFALVDFAVKKFQP